METIEKTIKDTVEQRTKDIQIQYIEVLGIFVTLFTFVSLNFQIFNQIDSLNYAVFIIVLIFLCLFGFIYLLHNILEKKDSTWQAIAVVLIALFILWIAPKIQLRPIDPFRSKTEERIKLLESKIEQMEWKIGAIFPGSISITIFAADSANSLFVGIRGYYMLRFCYGKKQVDC